MSLKRIIMNSIYKLTYNFGVFFSSFYGFKFNLFLTSIRTNIYSGWVSTKFKVCGQNLKIVTPLYAIGLDNIIIGDNFTAGSRLRIEAYNFFQNIKFTPQIIIGNNVNINFDCHIGCIDKIQIGNNVLIASKVLIIDHFHGGTKHVDLIYPPLQRPLISKGPILIGNNVWIGEGVVILPGVTIGENCIVGANSVLTKKFGSNLVIAGNPAQVIKRI